jgi:hypothetical protein
VSSTVPRSLFYANYWRQSKAAKHTTSITNPFQMLRDQSTHFTGLLMLGPRSHRRLSGGPKLGKGEWLAHHSGCATPWSMDASEDKLPEPLCNSSNLKKGWQPTVFVVPTFPVNRISLRSCHTIITLTAIREAEIGRRKCPC